MTLPLAHHNTIAALPVFVPAVIVCVVVAVHWFRNRGKWDDEEEFEDGVGECGEAPRI